MHLWLWHILSLKTRPCRCNDFLQKMENTVAAELKAGQIKKIAEALYNINTNFYESDFSRLYTDLRRKVTQRSLILLFTNFETLDALKRQLPYLRGIAKSHLLVIVFFKNAEVMKMMDHKMHRRLRTFMIRL